MAGDLKAGEDFRSISMLEPVYDGSITGFVCGDDRVVRREVKDLPTGEIVIKAWLTVKRRETSRLASDDDAVFQKVILAGLVIGEGQIIEAGTDGVAELSYDVTSGDLVKLKPKRDYFYDVQVKTNVGRLYTPEKGRIRGEAPITKST